MSWMIIFGCLVLVTTVAVLAKAAFRKPELRNRNYKNTEEIREKFQQLNQMSAQIRI